MIKLKDILVETQMLNTNSALKWLDGKKLLSIKSVSWGKYKIKWQKLSTADVVEYFGEAERVPGRRITLGNVDEVDLYVPHGFGLVVNRNSNFVAKGFFENGKLNGYVKLKFSDGDTFEGRYEDGNARGYGVYTFAESGETYKGEFIDNKRSGRGTQLDSNGTVIYTGNWLDDKPVPKNNKQSTDNEPVPKNNKQSAAKPGVTPTNWFIYPGDSVYKYQQRGGSWWARNQDNKQEFDISKNPAYKSTIDRLNTAVKNKTLIKV